MSTSVVTGRDFRPRRSRLICRTCYKTVEMTIVLDLEGSQIGKFAVILTNHDISPAQPPAEIELEVVADAEPEDDGGDVTLDVANQELDEVHLGTWIGTFEDLLFTVTVTLSPTRRVAGRAACLLLVT